jgi:hypothetical protein
MGDLRVMGLEKMVTESNNEEEYKDAVLGLVNKTLLPEADLASHYSHGCLMIMC